MAAFQLPWLPEHLGPRVFPQRDDPRYREAWAQPGALTSMVNYYRAMTPRTRISVVTAPTRVIWGERDPYLGPELAEPARADVPNLERVFRLDTSHWVQHEAPEEVTRLLAEFFALP
jgi:pimeloyl-ACP methyl ester carboxylesterase